MGSSDTEDQLDEIQEDTTSMEEKIEAIESLKNDNKTTKYLDPETKKFKEGNPGGGRPKGSGISITSEIKKKLAECPDGSKATYLQLLLNRIFKSAIQDGDITMIKDMINRVDGMPLQKSEIGGNDGKDLIIKIIEDGTTNNTSD
jgi:hypothetical protein